MNLWLIRHLSACVGCKVAATTKAELNALMQSAVFIESAVGALPVELSLPLSLTLNYIPFSMKAEPGSRRPGRSVCLLWRRCCVCLLLTLALFHHINPHFQLSLSQLQLGKGLRLLHRTVCLADLRRILFQGCAYTGAEYGSLDFACKSYELLLQT